jgi:hypothetical protein
MRISQLAYGNSYHLKAVVNTLSAEATNVNKSLAVSLKTAKVKRRGNPKLATRLFVVSGADWLAG